MTLDDLKFFMEEAFQVAEKQLNRDNYVTPVVLCLFEHYPPAANMLNWATEGEKNLAFATMNTLLKRMESEKELKAAVFITETWSVTVKNLFEFGDKTPSKHPSRKELLMACGACKNGRIGISKEIHRYEGSGRPYLKEDEEFSVLSGLKMPLFDGLWETVGHA